MQKRPRETERRIIRNNRRLRRLKKTVEQARAAVQRLADQQDAIRALDEYMSSGQWLADFEADERGEIDPSIDRGILSEDALYNTFEDLCELRDEINAVVESLRENPDHYAYARCNPKSFLRLRHD